MKTKSIFAASALVALAACTNEELVNGPDIAQSGGSNVMTFSVNKKNITRSAASGLEITGHYNFGVWCYKQVDATPTYQEVMKNYLVGFGPATDAKGYKPNSDTWGTSSNLTDSISQWFYENLGTAQYTNNDGNYYKASETEYMSNNAYQYLKYWDNSAIKTNFYAYAPYVKEQTGIPAVAPVTFDNDNETMTFPEVKAGWDDASKYEWMYANKVSRDPVTLGNYNGDVALTFHRITGQIRIAVYEQVKGYAVTMMDLKEVPGGTNVGIAAKPSTTTDLADASKYSVGNVVVSGEYVHDYKTPANSKFNTVTKSDAYLNFAIPAGITRVDAETGQSDDKVIATTRADALVAAKKSMSTSVYYCLPAQAGADANSGLMFHMSYTLKSLDTDEEITVKDARVYVQPEYTQWKSNTIYTYVFRITKNTTGDTGSKLTVDPDDPKPNTERALYPIVFDGIEVQDYDEYVGTWIVNPDATNGESNPAEDFVSVSTTLSDFNAGEAKEFTVTTTTSAAPKEWVKAVIDVTEGKDKITKMEYYEEDPVKGGANWKDLDVTATGYEFNSMGTGFPVISGSSLKLSITVSAATAIKAKVKLVGIESGTEYAVYNMEANAK